MLEILLPIILRWKNLTEYIYFDQNIDIALFLDLRSFCKYYLDSKILKYIFKHSYTFDYGYFVIFIQVWLVYVCDCVF